MARPAEAFFELEGGCGQIVPSPLPGISKTLLNSTQVKRRQPPTNYGFSRLKKLEEPMPVFSFSVYLAVSYKPGELYAKTVNLLVPSLCLAMRFQRVGNHRGHI